jgi:hypothetical protein
MAQINDNCASSRVIEYIKSESEGRGRRTAKDGRRVFF